jgi:hypothetical protein
MKFNSLVFQPSNNSDPFNGGVFQLFKNDDFNEEWNGTLVTDYIQEWIGKHRNTAHPLFPIFSALERQYHAKFPDAQVPRRVIRASLNGTSVADSKLMTEPHAGSLANFRWRNRTFLIHPAGAILNNVHFDELKSDFEMESIGTSLKNIGRYDLKSPIKKIRPSRAYYGDSQVPLVAVQVAVPELAIFKFESPSDRKGNRPHSFGRVSLIEMLQFKTNIVAFCWDERPSTVRDTQSLIILTSDGAVYLWQGLDKVRLLRSREAAEDVCEPFHIIRPTQGVPSITKIADVGSALSDDGKLPNYGQRIFFSGNPSCVLILTANSIEKVDFSRSASTQETLLSLFKPPSAIDVRHMKLRGQYDNVTREKKEHFGERKKQLLEEDEEAFRTTAQIRLEAEELDRPISDNPIYKFYTPVLVPFDVEFEALKAQGPTIRMMQDEMVCDAVQHPTKPYRFAILTTIRVYLLDERKPDTPLIQWRHHLVKSRRSLYERRIPFSLEKPHTVQFLLPPNHLSHLNSLDDRTFVLINSSLESEIYTFDEGPSIESVDRINEKTFDMEEENLARLPTYKDYKQQLEADLTIIMDSIVRETTKPKEAPAPVTESPQCLNYFIPPLNAPRLLGLPQKVFSNPVPLLQEVDHLNSEHITRLLADQTENIGATAIIGTWSFNNKKAHLSLMALRVDIRGHLFIQMHPLAIAEDDRESVDAAAAIYGSDNREESDSESDSSRTSDSSSSSSSSSKETSKETSSSDSRSISSFTSIESKSLDLEQEKPRKASQGDPRFSLNQQTRPRNFRPIKSRYMSEFKGRLAKTPREIAVHTYFDVAPLARFSFDPNPAYHPNESFPESVEQARLKDILACEGDYEALKKMVSGFSTHERSVYRAVRRRIDPYSQTLLPSETRDAHDEDEWDVSRPGQVTTEKKRRMEEDVDEEHAPSSKRIVILRKLPEETLELTPTQFEFFLQHLEMVLDDLEANPLMDPPPIDAKLVLDALPTDLASMTRICARVARIILKPKKGIRTTAEIYRELLRTRSIHPLYFPICFLRSILSYYVNLGAIDYISMRGIDNGTEMYGSYESGTKKPWTEQTRRNYYNHDPYQYHIHFNDELDTFALNSNGVNDVELQYIIGETRTPKHEPIPKSIENSTFVECWRAPRAPYPPPLDSNIEASPSLAAASQMDETQTMLLTQSFPLMTGGGSFGLGRSLSFSQPLSQSPLMRQPTAHQFASSQATHDAVHADLATQQTQIMEMLQTQQSMTEAEVQEDIIASDKQPVEMIKAPAKASQLMGLLLSKWKSGFEDSKERLKNVRKILRHQKDQEDDEES